MWWKWLLHQLEKSRPWPWKRWHEHQQEQQPQLILAFNGTDTVSRLRTLTVSGGFVNESQLVTKALATYELLAKLVDAGHTIHYRRQDGDIGPIDIQWQLYRRLAVNKVDNR